jgi:hypothetical protein
MNIRPEAWFATEEVEPGTWLVGEPGHGNCFLVAGADRAMLPVEYIGAPREFARFDPRPPRA